MIAMFTDFGLEGPYAGQMEAVLAAQAPGVPVVSLMHDAPAFNARASAYLLAAFIRPFPASSVFVCVVDPDVGSKRKPVMLRADDRWFVGPDNGLLTIVARRAAHAKWHEILWRPEHLSASFHGRDLFAPAAAMLACGDMPDARPCTPAVGADWPDDLAEVVYIDRYGNAMTGMRATCLDISAMLQVGGRRIAHARTFSEAGPGECFWYENAMGLVEIAANRASASALLDLRIGMVFDF